MWCIVLLGICTYLGLDLDADCRLSWRGEEGSGVRSKWKGKSGMNYFKGDLLELAALVV